MKYALFDADGLLKQRLIKGIHEIPVGAVPVSDALFARLLNEQDGQWRIDPQGGIDKFPLAQVVPDYARIERSWRDGELLSNEWAITRHRDELALQRATTLSEPDYIELLTYRQALRDWPGAQVFPDASGRPTAPAWLTDYLN